VRGMHNFKWCVKLFALLNLLIVLAGAQSGVKRRDFQIPGDGVRLFVREVITGTMKGKTAILLIHGARVPGLASFDLDVPNGSLASDLAQADLAVYVMDVRGYGRSTRPPEMNEPRDRHSPLVRSDEAVRDIDAVVDWIRKRSGQGKVALLGWAVGGHWSGYYSTLHSEKVDRLILLNTLYAGSDKHAMLGHGTDMENPQRPGQVNPSIGAYRFNPAESLLGVWDRNIPAEDKTEWRDPALAKAYVEAALASDPTSLIRTPPSFRSPSGAMEDSFYLAIGRRLWDASLIRVPTLIVAGERDFWSRPEDRELLSSDLVHAPQVKVVVISGATHFVHLDRPERGRTALLHGVIEFMGQGRTGMQSGK
jgi:pimeloyl-ACP methyl ester carboxylesterase